MPRVWSPRSVHAPILFCRNAFGLDHLILEHQDRTGHGADFIAPVRARYVSGQLAIRQTCHHSLQPTERASDVTVDEPGGCQGRGQDRRADHAQPEQYGHKDGVEIVDIGASEEHDLPRCEPGNIGEFWLGLCFPWLREQVGHDPSIGPLQRVLDQLRKRHALGIDSRRHLAFQFWVSPVQNDRAVPPNDDIARPSVKTHAVNVGAQMVQCLVAREPPRRHFDFQKLCNPKCRVDHCV